jgi:hypothetical protein
MQGTGRSVDYVPTISSNYAASRSLRVRNESVAHNLDQSEICMW